MATLEHFRSAEFLHSQAQAIFNFYARAFEQHGTDPFPQSLLISGACGADRHRHLVSACRYVVNLCRAQTHLDDARCETWARCAWQQLCDDFIGDESGKPWIWQHGPGEAPDSTQQMYGLAFIILAQARALESGIEGAGQGLRQAFDRAESLFFSVEDQLYADEGVFVNGAFRLGDYRGQNANMHACEALLVAHQVTGEDRYFERARALAHRLCVDIAMANRDNISEHYDQNWRPDWAYNRDDPKNLYRPWGIQIGHQIEWAKLLLMVHRQGQHTQTWAADRAVELFDRATQQGWDHAHGGLVYGVDRDGSFCDTDKHFWVQAEALSTAALVATHTQQARHWLSYTRQWEHALQHFVTESGIWRRVLDREHRPVDNYAARPGAKVDYHTLGAIFDILEL